MVRVSLFVLLAAMAASSPALADDLALPEPESTRATLPYSPMPAGVEALALPEPETEPIAPYVQYGCRQKDESQYLTN